MHVVAIVTAIATAGQTYLAAHWPLVAGLTGQVHVTTVELEGTAFVMVEIPRLPVTRVVTQSAIRAERALMFVFFGMAGVAGGFGVAEGGAQMAFFALYLGVFTQ